MQEIDRITDMARQAARLLPEPPDDCDIDGYLAWTELVWTTAMRLSAIAGVTLGEEPVRHLDVDLGAPVTAQRLMDLARIARLEWQQAPPVVEGGRQSASAAPGPVLAPPATASRGSASPTFADSCSTARRVLGARTHRTGRSAGGSSTRHH